MCEYVSTCCPVEMNITAYPQIPLCLKIQELGSILHEWN